MEKRSSRKKERTPKSTTVSADVNDTGLFNILVAWRKQEAKRQGLAAYRVLSTRTLIQLVNRKPRSRREFLAVPGCGPHTTQKYYEVIRQIIENYENS